MGQSGRPHGGPAHDAVTRPRGVSIGVGHTADGPGAEATQLPTVAQLLDQRTPLPGETAWLIAVDTARTLQRLHASGRVHGDVGAHTVMLDTTGEALLTEVDRTHVPAGQTPSGGQTPPAGRDVIGWTRLVTELAESNTDQQVGRLLMRAAQRVEAIGGDAGLAAGLAILIDATHVSVSNTLPATLRASDAPLAATSHGTARDSTARDGTTRDSTTRDGATRVEGWRQASTSVSTSRPGRVNSAGRARWRRGYRVLSAAIALVIVAVSLWSGWHWWQRWQDKVIIVSVDVAPTNSLVGKCNVQADIVGTVHTNGSAGSFTYDWLRSDGQTSGALRQSVASGQTSAKVHLYWQFSGKGTLRAKATLHILEPTTADGSAQFTYSCG